MLTYILIDASTYANIYIYIRKVRSQFILGGGYTQVTALNDRKGTCFDFSKIRKTYHAKERNTH